MKSSEFIVNENASAGASCAGGFAPVTKRLGETPKELIKRQKAYTNQRTPGGIVKGIKKTESK